MSSRLMLAASLAAAAAAPCPTLAQQPIDSVYSAKIRELTPTDPKWKFTTELVDHLPASATVPTPLRTLGYVPGTVGRLSHVADINRYFRALASSSPRARLFPLGMSDEGREMLLLAIADSAVIARLDDYREMLARLADTRGLASAERDRLVGEARPVYWLTGAIHSPETGSPEMLMELAYRLIVGESEHIRAIRAGVITLITPVLEVDGRDRIVDAYRQSMRLGVGPYGTGLPYWGKYTAHDNNRDGMVLSQRLTQNYIRAFLHWHPTVGHDLHESVPFLYASTGTGPYNEEFDPLVIDEWHTLAYQEITELTRRGLPGVWTHGFYDGWAPNYVLAIANLHNGIGRFYETYTSQGAECHTVRLSASARERVWYRPNPPVSDVKWCIRSNINYQQSGVLIALRYVADHRREFLRNFAAKTERMIERGRSSAPYAFVIPRGQRRAAEAADLVNLFRAQGSEVHEATEDLTLAAGGSSAARRAGTRGDSAPPAAGGPPARVTPAVAGTAVASGAGATTPAAAATGAPAPGHPPRDSVAADSAVERETAARAPAAADTGRGTRVRRGDWIVRMDQPYTQTVRTLLAVQRYKPEDPSPYDDTGWTLNLLRHVDATSIADSAVLAKPMRKLEADAVVRGSVSGDGPVLAVEHLGDWRSAVLPWKVAPARVSVATAAFESGGRRYPAGTFLVRDTRGARDAIAALGLTAMAMSREPAAARELRLPRIALVHSWIETQNEGWVRFAFDRLGIPYAYFSDQRLRAPGTLDRFDVVVFPHVSSQSASALVNGRPMVGPPLPWRKTPETPHLGVWDSTDDMRGGMGLEGAAALRRFVERGGVLITEGATSRLPVQMGFTTTVTIVDTDQLRARGGIYRAQIADTASPIVYGYEQKTFPLYFNQAPVLSVTARDTLNPPQNVDSAYLRAVERNRARVVVRFHQRADSLLLSGLLAGGTELAGRAAVAIAPVGRGHVVLFSTRPFWRWQTQGAFAMAINAMVNWNALGSEP